MYNVEYFLPLFTFINVVIRSTILIKFNLFFFILCLLFTIFSQNALIKSGSEKLSPVCFSKFYTLAHI